MTNAGGEGATTGHAGPRTEAARPGGYRGASAGGTDARGDEPPSRAMGIGWGLLAAGGRICTRSLVMATSIRPGDCVRLRDGRAARVRESVDDKYRVRVRRATSKSHQFLTLTSDE